MTRQQTSQTTALATVEQTSGEISVAQAQAMAKHEIESALVIAQERPRNEAKAEQAIMRACARPEFAVLTEYRYPRGKGADKTIITGGTVVLAREICRCWGNLRWGFEIVADDEEIRTVRAFAWDLETNAKVFRDSTFKKLIKRKGGWIVPDERDLRELTERMAAFATRNCVFDVLPSWLIELAKTEARKTVQKGAENDPKEARRQITKAFEEIGVSVDDLETFLGHSLDNASPGEIADLRPIYKSIRDNQARWVDFLPEVEPDDEKPKAGSVDALSGATATKTERPQAERAEKRSHSEVCRLVLEYLRKQDQLCKLEEIAEATQVDPGFVRAALSDMVESDRVFAQWDEDTNREWYAIESESPDPTESAAAGGGQSAPDEAAPVDADIEAALAAAIGKLQLVEKISEARAIRSNIRKLALNEEQRRRVRVAYRQAAERIDPSEVM